VTGIVGPFNSIPGCGQRPALERRALDRRDGVWSAMWESLHMDLREDLGREASPTAAVIDSQSLKSAE
jgi:hypothetical protein